uniref:Peptidase S1 domain-containing protein n=1 Tax=Panagrellus redivivus TaxID=6233 RepID=A0A7E4V776_PANRE
MLFKNPLLLISITTCVFCIHALHFSSLIDFNRFANGPFADVKSGFKPRIIEPYLPKRHSLPFIAFITIRAPTYQRDCTGSIIAPRYILTSLDCLVAAAAHLKVKVQLLLKFVTVRTGTVYKTVGGTTSPVIDFFTTNNTNAGIVEDIVILELSRNVTHSETAEPITLGRWQPKVGANLTIAGQTRIVNRRDVPVNHYVIGKATVSKLPPCHGTNYAFCVRDRDQGATPGDEGGPAYKTVNGEYVQVGMIRSGEWKETADNHVLNEGKYLLIAPFCNFIKVTTRGEAHCKTIH